MRDALKPVRPQPRQTDLPDNRPPVFRICALFAAIMASAHAVQEYYDHQQLRKQAALAPETCLQEQWRQASAQNGELPVIKDAAADRQTPANDHKPKTCPEFTPPVS